MVLCRHGQTDLPRPLVRRPRGCPCSPAPSPWPRRLSELFRAQGPRRPRPRRGPAHSSPRRNSPSSPSPACWRVRSRERFGGGGLNGVAGGTLTLLQVLKHVGRGSLPTGRIYEGHVNAHALVEWFGTPDQQTLAARDTVRDHRIFGVWNAEEEPPGIGLKLIDLGNGRYRMQGGKLFCSGLGRVTRPIIGGRWEGGGWQMCLVPMDEIAARVDHRWGGSPWAWRRRSAARLTSPGSNSPADTLLGAPDDYYREPGFNGGAIRFAAVQLGGAEAPLRTPPAAYLQNGKRTDHPVQRIRAAEGAMRIESGDLWLRGAAAVTERVPQAPWEIAMYAGMTRLSIETICLDTIRHVERIVGARGLIRPYPFPRMIRDLTMYLRQPAPDAVVDRVGRHVLDHPRPRRTSIGPRPRRKWRQAKVVNLMDADPAPGSLPPRIFRPGLSGQGRPVGFRHQPLRSRQVRCHPRRAAPGALPLGVRGRLLHRRAHRTPRPPVRPTPEHRRVRTGARPGPGTLRPFATGPFRETLPPGRISRRNLRPDPGFRGRLLPFPARSAPPAGSLLQPAKTAWPPAAGSLDPSRP